MLRQNFAMTVGAPVLGVGAAIFPSFATASLILRDFDGDNTTAEGVYDTSTNLTWGQGGEITDDYATAFSSASNYYGYTSSLPTFSSLKDFLYNKLGNLDGTDLVNDPLANLGPFVNPGESLSWLLETPGNKNFLNLGDGSLLTLPAGLGDSAGSFVVMQGRQGADVDTGLVSEPSAGPLVVLALGAVALVTHLRRSKQSAPALAA